MKTLKGFLSLATFAVLLVAYPTPSLQAQITGSVFRDYQDKDAQASFSPKEQEQSLAFVDAQVDDPEILLKSVESHTEEFHLFSHGRPGHLLIEGQWLGARDIARWLVARDVPQRVKQINLYGCNFAQGLKGRAAVTYLEKELGISIAASTNLTGVDGDWTLEIGQQSLDVDNYSHILQTNLL
ncbi:MAG TPA: DUF4347 domain-containing protein, partial [Saprospiraceae bacterium]|nr:DUF4347 domain-containing protein [Saprospiraceae bacterium]